MQLWGETRARTFWLWGLWIRDLELPIRLNVSPVFNSGELAALAANRIRLTFDRLCEVFFWLCLPCAGLPSKRTRTTGWRRWWSGTSLDFTKNQRWVDFTKFPPRCNQSLFFFFFNSTSFFTGCPPQGLKKPYNPIIGETFRCMWLHQKTNSKTFYIAEQVTAALAWVWKAFLSLTHTHKHCTYFALWSLPFSPGVASSSSVGTVRQQQERWLLSQWQHPCQIQVLR